MEVWGWEDPPLKSFDKQVPVAATIGVFDGIHIGHRALIKKVIQSGYNPMVITFRQNPREIIKPDDFEGDILPLESRLEIFDSLGIKVIVLIDFSINFSKLTGRVFLDRLGGFINLRQLIVGHDFQLGRAADTPAHELESILAHQNVTVDIMEPFTLGSYRVSSSLIRQAIKEGNLSWANQLLGQPYFLLLDGLPITGNNGTWFLDRTACRQVLPETGEYPVILECKEDFQSSILRISQTELQWTGNAPNPKRMIFETQ